MTQKTLSRWLEALALLLGGLGLVLYGRVVPSMGLALLVAAPEFARCYYPWLILIWLTAIPCYVVLVLGWLLAHSIGADRSFTMKNARRLSTIAVLAAGDVSVFFVCNVIFLLLDMNHPSVLIASGLILFIGLCFSAAAAALSHLTRKAAGLREQADLTI